MVNGTLINYYFHCKRQCYLHGNKINLEDNSEEVKIGRAIYEEKLDSGNVELTIDNIKIDKITRDYLVEVKKSDADSEAAKWQTLYYLKILKEKGIVKKGKIEFCEKNKSDKKTMIVELNEENERELDEYILKIEKLLECDEVPKVEKKPKCKKCAYYYYCYI